MLSVATTTYDVGHLRHTGPPLHRYSRETGPRIEKCRRVIVDQGQLPTRRRRGVPGPPGNSMAAITRNSAKPAKQRSESSIGVSADAETLAISDRNRGVSHWQERRGKLVMVPAGSACANLTFSRPPLGRPVRAPSRSVPKED